jgi:predicted dehydrogenase
MLKSIMKNSRRDFVKKAVTGAAAISVGGILPGLSARSYGKIIGSNERITVACMGVNSRGLAVGTNFANQPDAEVLYVSDPDSRAADKFIDAAGKIQNSNPKAVPDFRKTLEDKQLDVLMIAAPDHWHVPASILALQAGKHVYVEKPCSHNPREGELLLQAIKKYNRVVQMGNQRRSKPSEIGAIEELRAGAIGRPYFAKVFYANNRESIGVGKKVAVPSWLNYELWQGPAPRQPYQDNIIHYNWHWFWKWGTGEAANTGTHVIDIARWGLGADFPVKVSSSGGRYRYNDDWQTPDTQVINAEFPNKTFITYEGRSCNRQTVEGGVTGVIFYGETGSLSITDSVSYKIFDLASKLIKEVKPPVPVTPTKVPTTASQQSDALHIRNFFDGIRTGAKLNSDIFGGFKSTLIAQLGNISVRTGHTLNINPENGHIINDPIAMKYWSRQYQPGWEPKV